MCVYVWRRCMDPKISPYFKSSIKFEFIVALKGTRGFNRDEAQSN